MNITVSRLDNVCQVIMGQAPSGEAYNTEGQGWSLIAGAGDFGDIYPAAKKFTTEASKLSCAGDIILGIRATVGEKVLSDGEYCLGRGVAALRPHSTLDFRYLWHWLDHIRPQLVSKARGATFKQVSRQDIGELAISLPPIAEQKRIAAILDKAEELRGLRRRALSQLDNLAQSIFLEMFGDPVKNPQGLKTLTFGELAPDKGAIVDGPFGSTLKPQSYVDTGVRVVRNFNIHDVVFDESEFVYVTKEKFTEIYRSHVCPGDILLSTKGTIGNVCIMPNLSGESVLSASGTVRIRLPQNSPLLAEFIVHQMIQKSYKQYLKEVEAGTNQKYLNLGGIRRMKLIIPPLSLQQEFARRVEAIEQLKTTHRESLAQLDALFASLQHRAFRGEL